MECVYGCDEHGFVHVSRRFHKGPNGWGWVGDKLKWCPAHYPEQAAKNNQPFKRLERPLGLDQMRTEPDLNVRDEVLWPVAGGQPVAIPLKYGYEPEPVADHLVVDLPPLIDDLISRPYKKKPGKIRRWLSQVLKDSAH